MPIYPTTRIPYLVNTLRREKGKPYLAPPTATAAVFWTSPRSPAQRRALRRALRQVYAPYESSLVTRHPAGYEIVRGVEGMPGGEA